MGTERTLTLSEFTWHGKTVLCTGGTGTFGQAFAKRILQEPIAGLRIYSRGELAQVEMARRFTDSRVKFLIGDVRDRSRLHRAFNGVDVVVHAAALKQVPVCEADPLECKKTNIDGASNVIEAALDRGVERVMGLSTDKAAAPLNTYGKSKAFAEALFLAANIYAGAGPTKLAAVRYGNVAASRGSLIPLLLSQKDSGTVTITDNAMTRFWFTIGQAVEFTISRIEDMQGGELFIPKLKSTYVTQIVRAIAPQAQIQHIGIRPGEKLDEVLITADESRRAHDMGSYYVLNDDYHTGAPFTYDSGANVFLSDSDLAREIPRAIAEAAA